MNCSQCGTNLLQDANFCHRCGTPIEKTEIVDAEDVETGASWSSQISKLKDASLIWNSGDIRTRVRLFAHNLDSTDEEKESATHSVEDVVRLIGNGPSSVEKIEYDESGDLISHIFTAWR